MPDLREQPLRFTPRGVSDTVDGDNSPPGACMSLANLMYDPATPGVLVCRPANLKRTDFTGFSTPGVVSIMFRLGNIIYGLIASAHFAGHDEPFAYNVVTDTFQTVVGATAANTPATPATSGAWTPPTADMVGQRIIVTHPGFNFAGGYAFGYFDISGFTSTPTGTTAIGSPTITGVSSTDGIGPGYAITGVGIPANTTVLNVTTTTITLSANATAAGAVTLTVTGGSAASPLWAAGNTTGALQLVGVPQEVREFNNRAYFAQSNNLIFTDTLSLNISNAGVVQVLTVGDSTAITGLCGLPIYTTSGGVLQALIALKANYIQQITGDSATSDLAQNEISDSVGTSAGRSVVATPQGIAFMANDGIRKIDLSGQLSEPNADLAIPFIYAVQPSRVCAAFNADTYRICVQNGQKTGTPYEGYYYGMKQNAWTGPHSFRDDCLVPYGNDFITVNNSIPATLWQSFSVQGHSNEGNTFIENGTQLSAEYTTCPITDLQNMYANCAIRSTLDIALAGSGALFTFQALDVSNGVLGQANITAPTAGGVWLAFDWGDGTLWGAQQFGLRPISIPWTEPLIFNKLISQVRTQSALGLKFGSWYHGYKRLNFLMQE